jgi:hypothetical protein
VTGSLEGRLNMDLLIPLCSALAVGLVAVVFILTLVVPMLVGLLDVRR